MDLLPLELQDVTTLRRIIFAAVHLPKDLPQYWSIVAMFASRGSKKVLQPESVRIAIENLWINNENAFVTDIQLVHEIHSLSPSPSTSFPLGIVLISSNSTCGLCDGELLLRNDRPSHITVYTESWGTVIGTHYHKFCQHFRKGCTFRQYYGYTSSTSDKITVTT